MIFLATLKLDISFYCLSRVGLVAIILIAHIRLGNIKNIYIYMYIYIYTYIYIYIFI